MKKMRFIRSGLIAVLGVGIIALTAQADIWDKPSGAARGIKASKHNLSNWSLYKIRVQGDTTQVCIFCHTPHNADSSVVPLWGHKDNEDTGFTMASSFWVKGNGSQGDDRPTGISKKCLSCHDGTVAVGAVAGGDIAMTGTGVDVNGLLLNTAKGFIGKNLASGHVVSFAYDTVFDNSTSAKLKSRASMDAADQKSMFDRQGKMQCHSCHDPHTDWCDDPSKTVGPDPLWRKKCDPDGLATGKTGSNATVCVVCHNKTTFSGYTQAFPYGPP